jgi:signal transduction histidine kinase
MEAHGGNISVANNPGRGASFVMKFQKPTDGNADRTSDSTLVLKEI